MARQYNNVQNPSVVQPLSNASASSASGFPHRCQVIPREHMLAYVPAMVLGAMTPLLPMFGCCLSKSFEKWLDSHLGGDVVPHRGVDWIVVKLPDF